MNLSTQEILALKMEPFTQEKSRQDLIEMIVVDDMPFTLINQIYLIILTFQLYYSD